MRSVKNAPVADKVLTTKAKIASSFSPQIDSAHRPSMKNAGMVASASGRVTSTSHAVDKFHR